MIIGIDEVGRGPIAGPVVVCGAAFPPNFPEEIKSQLKDSKKLTASKRIKIAELLKENNLYFVLSECSPQEIDELGISTCLRRCVRNIENEFLIRHPNEDHYFILDGNVNYLSQRGETMIKGDDRVHECMAASIIAKEYRDELMTALHHVHPEYGWDSNSGYGTKKHYDAISTTGITSVHRKSFLKKILNT